MKGCLQISLWGVAISVVIGCLLFLVPLFTTKPLQRGEDAAESGPVERILSSLRVASAPHRARREWTDLSGRTIDGTLVSADEGATLVRVHPADRLYRIPRARLSPEDNAFLDQWISNHPAPDFFPPFPDRWPRIIDGRSRNHPISDAPSRRNWNVAKTQNYEFYYKEKIDSEVLDGLVLVSESIDIALRSVPLPLLWGRDEDAERVIKLYHSAEEFRAAGAMPEWAGFYDPANNEVHVQVAFLKESDLQKSIGKFALAQRNEYDLLTHELVHQASAGVGALRAPAWVAEGLAEYFSAIQDTPGKFVFHNQQQSVIRHLSRAIGGEGIYELETLRLQNLSSFSDISLREFNRATKTEFSTNYMQSLIMVEYFCHGDGNSLRPYLEDLLTGSKHEAAFDKHLRRGRSDADLEQKIIDRWQKLGLTVVFQKSGTIQRSDVRGDIGTGSLITPLRRSL